LLLTGCASSNPIRDDAVATPTNPQRVSSNVITADDIAHYPNSTTVQEILQFHVPGFRVTGDLARPGGGVGVSILGMGTPVFVLDGIIVDEPSIALGINPRDVERIEVLKHGASTSLFGFRGSNGAVVITTKN
jgi:TonB-dependent SusC/RagA subfamily outer membrane receptor